MQPLSGISPGRNSRDIPNVPAFAQEKDLCGAAALAAMLCWTGLDISPPALASQVYDPEREGSLQSALISASRRHGRVAYEIHGAQALWQEIDAGRPVLVLVNKGLSWWPVWHYAVVCGYAHNGRTLLLAGGKAHKERLSWDIFERTWARSKQWGLLVLKPKDLPVTAVKTKWLQAVHGVELAGRHQEALTGYETALHRWPENLTALMGKANCLYALNRLDEAATTLRLTAEAHPQSGPVYNNLAQVLLEQGRVQAALAAINKALQLGGPHTETYRQTKAEILQRK